MTIFEGNDTVKDVMTKLNELFEEWAKKNLKPYQTYKNWSVDKEGVFIHYTYEEQLNNIDYSIEEGFEFIPFDNL